MNIADLFLNLGIKGTEKTVGALSGVEKGLKQTSSMALETKVALVAAAYAMERLFAASGQRGTDLTNLNSILGVSTKTLQQYEYAARQVGVSNEEVDGTFKALQSTMTKTLMGEGAPKGLARVATLTGGISPQDIQKFAQKPELLIQKLQEYAQKEQNAGLKAEVLKSFGVSDNMMAALNRKAFRPEILSAAPTYSNKETGQLDKANIAWSNLRNTVEMSIGHFNAKHGNELVGGITKIIPQIIKLAEAFVKLGEKLHALEWFGKAIQAWSTILGGLTDVVDAIGGDKKKQDELKESWSEYGSGLVEVAKGVIGGIGTPTPLEAAQQGKPLTAGASPAISAKSIMPNMPATAPASASHNTTINQNLNFQHDGKDATKTGDSTKKAIKDAFRQIPAQGQGT